jgi:guanine nucleotide-binding protein subunit alpha
MEESLALFRVILSSDYFHNASVILFLNKTDLFPERLAGKPLQATYPDYNGNFTIEPIV